ncbi:MAG: FliG C-terminal domain-containing protein [Desulfobacterales bacterium]|jgi:hypothetical protein
MQYDAEFCRQMRVSDSEKDDCLALISDIIYLATSARNYGLLSLGKEAEESESFLLRKGLELALDGVKSETARTILELYIFSADYKGKELLERCIILEGVIAILEGMHPKLLKELLLSFLGESSHDVYKEEFDIEEIEKLKGYLKSVEDKPAASESGVEMGNLLEPLNNQAIKQFLQTISIEDLAKVMSDLDGKAQVKLFNKLTKRGAFLLLDAIEHHDSFEAQEMEEAHEKVVVILNDLQNQASLQ